jgi:hypothetical protein
MRTFLKIAVTCAGVLIAAIFASIFGALILIAIAKML